MISKRYNAQMGNYLAKLAQEQNNLGTWQESIIKEYKTKQTNADRIRGMSDEELSELFSDNDCGYCRIHDFCFAKGCQINCEDVWLDWLKQEVET